MEVTIRDELRPGDLEAIVAHHRRIYGEEYAVDYRFGDFVAAAVARAAERGFPSEREAIRIVELDGEHAGSIGLSDEGDDEAAIRWVVLSPEVRGNGLGRRLVGEMLAFAEEHGYRRVWLETFSELEAAAHLYRDHGFVLTGADTAPRWGRDSITMQRYELELVDRAKLSA
ncbi:MAG TPA: GNAT family N-acetyltransferase [Solirubrobacterales bacterium]